MRYGVYEIGMSNPGEILPLARMVQPDVAIVTTVQPVHLAAFDSIEGIAQEKAAIFSGLKPGGTAIINADIAAGGAAARAGAGQPGRADRQLRRACPMPMSGCSPARCGPMSRRSTRWCMGQPVTYRLGSPGKHIVLNSLAVLAAVEALGADLALAALALGDLQAARRTRRAAGAAGAGRARSS